MMIRALSIFTTEEYNGQSGEEITFPLATSRSFRVDAENEVYITKVSIHVGLGLLFGGLNWRVCVAAVCLMLVLAFSMYQVRFHHLEDLADVCLFELSSDPHI